MVPVRLSSISVNSRLAHAGLRQNEDSRGKKMAPQPVQRVPSSAGRSGSMVNQPSTAGSWVLAAMQDSSGKDGVRPRSR